MLTFDHLAVVAATLDDGGEHVRSLLGVTVAGGGKHPLMGTHNRLIGMGDLYLEVIAIDPDAPRPDVPRWFDMDNHSGRSRLANWVVRCDDIDRELMASPQGAGVAVPLARGDYRWQMAIPPDGKLPFDGAFPALIQWEGRAHPTQALPDCGLRLRRLEIAHPEAATLRALLAARLTDARVVFVNGDRVAMRATFDGPAGIRVLE